MGISFLWTNWRHCRQSWMMKHTKSKTLFRKYQSGWSQLLKITLYPTRYPMTKRTNKHRVTMICQSNSRMCYNPSKSRGLNMVCRDTGDASSRTKWGWGRQSRRSDWRCATNKNCQRSLSVQPASKWTGRRKYASGTSPWHPRKCKSCLASKMGWGLRRISTCSIGLSPRTIGMPSWTRSRRIVH